MSGNSTYRFKKLDDFHPAQSFHGRTAYFGVRLDKEVPVGNNAVTWEPSLAFVTSDHELIDADVAQLSSRGLAYHGKFPYPPESRMSPEAIAKWMDKKYDAPVPAALYQKMRKAFTDRIDFPYESVADLCVCYAIGTYLYNAFDAFPYLNFTGSKASGKTKTARMVSFLSFNSIEAAALTGGALFLEVQGHGATLLLDDREDLGGEETRALDSMLHVGYKKGGRTIRGDWQAQAAKSYSVYSPKIITTIKGVTDVLRSRCITIEMQPSDNPALKHRSEDQHSKFWDRTRDDIYVWAMNEWFHVKETYDDITPESTGLANMTGRSWELWKPIMAIAHYFQREGVDGLVDRMGKLATRTFSDFQSEEVDSFEGLVLAMLKQKVVKEPTHEDYGHTLFTVADFVVDFADETGERIQSTRMGKVFKRFGFAKYAMRSHPKGRNVYRIPEAAIIQAAIRRGIEVGPAETKKVEEHEAEAAAARRLIQEAFQTGEETE